MINSPYETEFVFHDGQRAKNLLELNQLIEKLSLDEFSEFVNNQKNDFANWVNDVLNDKKLAAELYAVRTKRDTLVHIRFRINELITEQSLLDLSARNSTEFDKISASENKDKHEHKSKWHKIFSRKHHEKKDANVAEQKEKKEIQEKTKQIIFEQPKKIEPQKVQPEQKETREKSQHINEKDVIKQTGATFGEIMWIILYGLLIGLIIFLILYKFVFKGQLF